jgi:hypothetical protein
LYEEPEADNVSYVLPDTLGDHPRGCAVYRATGHWHYVTYGLSEMFPVVTGRRARFATWDHELTMRISADADLEPPRWPTRVIEVLASRVAAGKLRLSAGQRVDLRWVGAGSASGKDAPHPGLTGLAVALDPQLGRVTTPHGVVTFLQLVGITAAEKDRMATSSTAAVLEAMAETNPLLITGPVRVAQ